MTYIYEGVIPTVTPTDGGVLYIDPSSAPSETGLEFYETKIDASKNPIPFKESSELGFAGSLISKKLAFDDKANVGKATMIVGELDLQTGKIKLNNDDLEVVYSSGLYEVTSSSGETKVTEIPLLFAGEISGTRTVIIMFRLNDSSLPMYITDYVILVGNIVQYLAVEK